LSRHFWKTRPPKQTKCPERGQKCWQRLASNRSPSPCVAREQKGAATFGRPGRVVGALRPPGQSSPASRPLPPAGNWVRFPGSIPRLFVLSHNASMINTKSKLASFLSLFTHHLLPASHSLATDHWPLTTSHCSCAPRRDPPGPAGVRSCADPLPAGYCLTPTAELAKTERDPISTSGPSIFSMSPKFSV